jgi:hypothetical protein
MKSPQFEDDVNLEGGGVRNRCIILQPRLMASHLCLRVIDFKKKMRPVLIKLSMTVMEAWSPLRP